MQESIALLALDHFYVCNVFEGRGMAIFRGFASLKEIALFSLYRAGKLAGRREGVVEHRGSLIAGDCLTPLVLTLG